MADDTPLPNTSTDTGPLDWRIAITDKGGRPTPEFQRRWNTQRNNNGLIGATIGHGTPTGTPASDGLIYIDEDTSPGTEYVSIDGHWVRVSVSRFNELQDVPQSYTGHAGNLVWVRDTEDGLAYTTITHVLDEIDNTRGDILYRGASGWSALGPGTSGQVLTAHGVGTDPTWTTPGATGVSSVGLAAPSIFTVSGSPVTTSGTLTFSMNTQNANLFLAGPSTGVAATPTYRSIAATDLPLATTGAFGAVKPDGTTITISSGVISSVGGATGANPTATASDTVVNGSATTYMRSDAAPAVQKASSSIFGLVKVDGTTITATGGVISSSGGGGSTNTFDRPIAQALWAASTGLFATKANLISPTETFTIDAVYAGMASGTAGRVLTVTISQVTTASNPVVTAIIGTATATIAGSAAITQKVTFASPVTVTAGNSYMIAVSWTNAATGTTALAIQGVGTGVNSPPNYTNIPNDNSLQSVSSNYNLAKTSVSTADTFVLNNTAAYDITIRCQLGASGTTSGAANLVSATPNGSSGIVSLRALVGADLPVPSASTLGGVQSKTATTHQFLTSISTAGVPIAAQPSSADLSDVVSGTWTPVDASGAGLTLTFTNASYIRSGKLIVATINQLTWPTTANTANAIIGGLPISLVGAGVHAPAPILNISTIAAPIFIFPNTTDGLLHIFTSGAAFGAVTNAQLSTGILYVQIVYGLP